MTKIAFGRDVDKISKIISNEMPVVSFVIWDLTPFMSHLHNWRKNIIFIECDRVAVESLVEMLGNAYPDFKIYAGINKPVLKTKLFGKNATIVITARDGKKRVEVSGSSPKLEKCLVDLLYYAKNELLNIPLNEVLGLWRHYLTSEEVHFNELYRYSLRRYLGWFVSILAYELSKKEKINADARHCRTGSENLALIKMVTKLE